jgi:hypothetical protein
MSNKAKDWKLFEIALKALEQDGYVIEKIPGKGKSSLRKISKDGTSQRVTIRTSGDGHGYIAFQRSETAWLTLPEVDSVVAVSVRNKERPEFAHVDRIEGKEIQDRLDQQYADRLAEGYIIRPGHPVYLSLADLPKTWTYEVPLTLESSVAQGRQSETNIVGEEPPLTISEAKRRLAISLGVDPSNIKISIEA